MAVKLTGQEQVQRRPLLSMTQTGEPELAPDFVGQQAAKLGLALGPDSPGKEVLSSSLLTGQSLEYKRLLADRDRLQQIESRNDVMNSIAQMDRSAVTPEVVNVVQGLSEMELQSPDLSSIIEEKYSKLYTNFVAAEIDNGILEESMEDDEEGTYELLDRHERIAFKKNLVATESAKLHQEIQGMSLGSTVWNMTERMVPFLEWYQKQNAVGNESDFVSSFLSGSNLQEQYAYLWGLQDTKRFRDEFTAAVAEMKARNPFVAQSWIEGFFSYGGTDAVVEDLLGIADIAGVVPLKTLGTALKGAVRGAAKNPETVFRQAADLGKYDAMAEGKLISDLQSGTFFPDNIKGIKGLEDSVPSIAAPDRLLTGIEKLPAEAQNRLRESFMKDSELVRRFLYEPNLVDRANPEDLLQYTPRLREQYIRDNPTVEKNVIDVEIASAPDVGNVYQARVILGRRDGTLFESEAQARTYFNRYIKGTDDFEVTQVGQGFRIEIMKNVDESDFFNLTLPTSVKTPESFANSILSNLRSPNYTLSRDQELARSTAVTSMEALTGIFEEIAAPLKAMSKKEFDELSLLMNNRRFEPRFEDVGQFEKAFHDMTARVPSVEQIEGYFAASRIHDLDLIVRDLDVYKQKASLGIEDIKVKFGDQELGFEGRVIDDLPFGSAEDFRVTVIENGKKSKTTSSRYLNQKDKDRIQTLRSQGYKIIQSSDLLKMGEREYTNYIVANQVKRDRIGVQNFERRPELGHKVDTYNGYIKQGRISKDDTSALYKGDTTLFGAKTQAEGREFVKLLEEARQKFLRGDADALKFVRDRLGIDTKRWTAAVEGGLIDLSVPFSFVRKGGRTIDTGVYSNLPNLRDAAKSEHSLSGRVMGRYLGERDSSMIDVIRSEGDMVFEVAEAEFLSPMETLRRSSQNVLSVRMMNDYTMMTNRNFLREFGDILDGTREELLSSGISALLNPTFKTGADPVRISQARTVSQSYRNLLNMGTDLDRTINLYKDKLLSSVLPKLGPRGQQWVSDRLMSTVKDPGVYLRSFAFNTKLGMFNPIQYFVQANSLVNVASIAGANGLKGMLSYTPMRAALMSNNPTILKRVAKIAETTGLMSARDFEESVNLYKKSGFHIVGRDTAFMDDVRAPELRRSAVGQATQTTLAYGRTPFQEGERMVRMAAWQAAYLEKRASLGTRAMSRRDEAELLQRAKDLTANMTRESNAPWQKGYSALVTQFWGYQARVMEQFIGKKLTAGEKARLFIGYSAVYGIPVATGATMGFIPWRDIVLNTAMEAGWDVNDTAFEPFVDGLSSAFYEAFFGRELNIADRYGPGGISTFYDIFRGDAELSDWLMGASGSIGLETVTSAMPILKGMWSWANDGPGGYYNLTPEDFLAPLRNISTVDNATKLWQVYQTGVWASKNGTNITEMDLPEGVIAALTGLQPARIEDSFRALSATTAHREWLRSRQDEATKEMRKAINMEVGPEQEKMIREIKAQMVMDGLDVRQRNEVFKRAFSGEMLSDTAFENFEKQFERHRRLRGE